MGQPGLEPGIAGFGDRCVSERRRSGKPNETGKRFKGEAKGKNHQRNLVRTAREAEGDGQIRTADVLGAIQDFKVTRFEPG